MGDSVTLPGKAESKTFSITDQGRRVLFSRENQGIVLTILGKAMEDLGDQFTGYGIFTQELAKVRKTIEASEEIDTDAEEFPEEPSEDETQTFTDAEEKN